MLKFEIRCRSIKKQNTNKYRCFLCQHDNANIDASYVPITGSSDLIGLLWIYRTKNTRLVTRKKGLPPLQSERLL